MEKRKEENGKTPFDVKEKNNCQWKVPGQGNREGDTKHDSSSTSSFLSGSNFTMSCSGADEPEENEPSTSGCSSFLPQSQRNSKKEKKKARVHEYLKELKALVKPSKGGSQWKMGTLSTLEHVLSSMKKIKEAKAKHQERKMITDTKEQTPYSDINNEMMQPVYESDSHDSLASASLKSSDELRVILSGSYNVEAVSGNLQYVVGYPKDRWIGRTFIEYLHKKDLITFRSACKQERESDPSSDSSEGKAESKVFYVRLRKFKSLGSSGFSLRKQDQYVPFQCTATMKKMTDKELEMSKQQVMPSWYEDVSISANSGSPETIRSGSSDNQTEQSLPDKVDEVDSEGKGKEPRKLYTILYCVPLITPYSESGQLPEINTFETRHTLFCSYCHIQPDAISLLGYLPQEMIGMPIFDFYHNDDLNTIYKSYQKVIALRGVPFKSGPIRLLVKNGSYITCIVEWTSFVNPWSNRLEFIVGKHTVIKCPENTDVFSENYQIPSSDEIPESIVQLRQKIKDLLLQPVQSENICSSPEIKKHRGKTVAILDKKDEEEIYSERELVSQTSDHSKVYCNEREHNKGIFIKEASISRAYEQLNYTNCIKKFLLGQPRTFSSDSDVKKSSSEDGFDCEDVKESVPADAEFDFDINVPKPPSFGSSTKVVPVLVEAKILNIPTKRPYEWVLVSEQEHRDVENLLEPVSLREQLQLPTSQELIAMPFSPLNSTAVATQTKEAPVSADKALVMNLTRELLLKHTILQEQLYVATASPERNVLFVNESREGDTNELTSKRQTLKRTHSPDGVSQERGVKTGRHSEVGGPFSSVLNPTFPLMELDKESEECQMNRELNVGNVVTMPMHLYPVTSLGKTVSSSSSGGGVVQSTNMQQWPFYQMTGTSLPQQVMVGFHRSLQMQQSSLPNISMPIPVYDLNSYMMQQANHAMPKPTRTPRKKQERVKSKAQAQQSSSESSSTEDTSSSMYLLESSVNNMKMVYNELVMQSLAQQSGRRGLKPAPWLENVGLSENMQLKYHLPRQKQKRQLKKDREALEKMRQPDMVVDQLNQLYEDLDSNCVLLFDEEQDFVLQRYQDTTIKECCCMKNMCCTNDSYNDHGIMDAIKAWRKAERKEKRGRKVLTQKSVQEDMVQVDDKMDVDSDNCGAVSLCPNTGDKSKTDSCSSSKSCDSGEGDGENFIRCDMSSDSITSLNSSDVTPSDQRSNNENGSSMKESDGDAMSKKSDSSASDKQQTSESESDSKSSFPYAKFKQLFGTLSICFPHLHKENPPWLIDVDFTDDLQYRYISEPKNKETVLEKDRELIEKFTEQETVQEQLKGLIEEISVEKGWVVSMPPIEEEEAGGSSERQEEQSALFQTITKFDEETLNNLFMNF